MTTTASIADPFAGSTPRYIAYCLEQRCYSPDTMWVQDVAASLEHPGLRFLRWLDARRKEWPGSQEPKPDERAFDAWLFARLADNVLLNALLLGSAEARIELARRHVAAGRMLAAFVLREGGVPYLDDDGEVRCRLGRQVRSGRRGVLVGVLPIEECVDLAMVLPGDLG